MKMDSTCRVCLSDRFLHPLFSTNCSANGLRISCLEMLKFCSSHPIDQEDKFPKQICSNCVSKLIITYKFKLLYEESYKKMMNHLSGNGDLAENSEPSLYDVYIKQEIVSSLDEKTGDLKRIIRSANDGGEGEGEGEDGQSGAANHEAASSDEPVKKPPPKKRKRFKKRVIKITQKGDIKTAYFCEICQKHFCDELRHKAKMHGAHGILQCELCAAVFQAPYTLKLHMRHHSKDLPCVCAHPGCGKAYPIPGLLRQHAKSHTNDRPYICQYCSHATRNKHRLVEHIRYRHTKEKMFKCSFCEKSFVSYQALCNHDKRHRNIKDYHCQLCEKTFVSSSGLVSHMVSHNKEKRFECRLCSTRFTRKAQCKKHEASVHGALPIPDVVPISCLIDKNRDDNVASISTLSYAPNPLDPA